MTIPQSHEVAIAKMTMRYGCAAARAIFNTSHAEAIAVLRSRGQYQRGPDTHLPKDCTCCDGQR